MRNLTFFLLAILIAFPFLAFAEDMAVTVENEAPATVDDGLDNSPEFSIETPTNKEEVKRAFWEQETKIVGLSVGFGMGHLMAGEYLNKGWIYTAAELGTLTAFVVGVSSYFGDTSFKSFGKAMGSFLTVTQPETNHPTTNLATMMMVTGFVGFLAARLLEGFEVWNKPRIVVLNPPNDNKMSLEPTFFAKEDESIGLNLRF